MGRKLKPKRCRDMPFEMCEDGRSSICNAYFHWCHYTPLLYVSARARIALKNSLAIYPSVTSLPGDRNTAMLVEIYALLTWGQHWSHDQTDTSGGSIHQQLQRADINTTPNAVFTIHPHCWLLNCSSYHAACWGCYCCWRPRHQWIQHPHHVICLHALLHHRPCRTARTVIPITMVCISTCTV